MLHVWYIYLQNWVIFRANDGKYSSTMEHMVIWVWWIHLKCQERLGNSAWKPSSKAVPRRHFVHRAHAGDLTGQRRSRMGPPSDVNVGL